ncbi:MAG TPA: nucleotidyltransferase domain-containing protein [Thermoanaerobaculia bacterium]|nr:nucleotidyltransferase domain-containing protein [Thermoanaerobaculia bacterium]
MRLETPLDDIFRGPSHVRVLRALHQVSKGLSLSARAIARRAGVSHPTASKVLSSLTDQGLVARSRVPRGSFFRLRRTNTAVDVLRTLFDWEEGLMRELIDLLRSEIDRHAPRTVTAVFLFGSAARGDMSPGSDIDVAVVHRADAAEEVALAMEEIGERVQERFGNRVSFVFADAPVKELQSSGREGARLWGKILQEGIPVFDTELRAADG